MRTWPKILLFCGAVVGSVLLYLTLLSMMARGATTAVPSIIPAAVLALSVLTLNRVFLKREGQSLGAVGFELSTRPLHHFALAVALGFALVAAWCAIVAAVGHAHWEITGRATVGSVAAMCAFMLFNNSAEELAYRAWAFLALERKAGRWFAMAVPSFVFAAAHVQGGLPWQSALTGVLTTGLLYAALFDRTRSVPFVAGFHIANNIGQEVLGLRTTAASVLAPRFNVALTQTQGLVILGAIAALNVLLIVAVAHRGASHAAPGDRKEHRGEDRGEDRGAESGAGA